MFPMIDLAIKPKPNAALVWYGRDLAGVADIRQVIFSVFPGSFNFISSELSTWGVQ